MSGFGRNAARVAAAVALTATMACTPIYRDHGYVPLETDLAAIRLGSDTRDTVAEKLGVPSTLGVVNDSGYYYVSSRFRTIGPLEPEVVSREIVAVNFDARGRVSGVERYGLTDGRAVPLSRRVTSTSTDNKGFLRQLLGNLGRFSAGDFLGGG